MSKATVAVIQMQCTKEVRQNIENAEKYVRQAADMGGQIILLPELFERQYFCQERQYGYYSYALSAEENPAVCRMRELARELSLVIIVSFYEKSGNVLYNSAAVVDADGSLLGVYRKTHIPDDHFYQEKFYFTPGDTGFTVWDTQYGKVGVGICWDQWFPETARCLALKGADVILYPTAIGSEPILDCDSSGHWMRTMQGHAAANIVPVAAANRYGVEMVEPCAENAEQNSALEFYGSSFITDETGDILCSAKKSGTKILLAQFDFEKIRRERLEWGLFRDRRPDCYGEICGHF
jgi:N-carbamoylputrescine amidase